MSKAAAKQESGLLFGTRGGDAPTSETATVRKPPKGSSAVKPAPIKKQEVVVHEPQQPRSVLELCLMAAKQPDIPVDRLRAFLDMADEQERKEAEILFDHAMHAAQLEMPQIPRDSYNKHTKSWWARIETVSAKIDPIIRKHGFTLRYGMVDSNLDDHYNIFADVTWIGVLASGKRASFTKRWAADIGRDDKGPKGEGTKSLAQGSGSSITFGRRYLKCMIFDVLVLGLDKDGNPVSEIDSSLITEEQADELLRMCADKNIGADLFSKAFGVSSFADLPARRFEEAKSRLTLAPAQQAKQKQQEQNHDAG